MLDSGKTFLTGNLYLRSNVELHLSENTTLKQSPNSGDYVRIQDGRYVAYEAYKGHDYSSGLWNHACLHEYPLVYAGSRTEVDIHDVKVTGDEGAVFKMDWQGSCDKTIHICPAGFFDVDGFELSGITVSQFTTYGVSIYGCVNGLVKDVTLLPDHKSYQTPENINGDNTDGFSIRNSQNLRITGCDLHTGDDAIYITSMYNDPRGGDFTWWDDYAPMPCKNIELDHNKAYARPGGTCKGFGLISWGTACPDQSKVEICDIYVHDNEFNRIGVW